MSLCTKVLFLKRYNKKLIIALKRISKNIDECISIIKKEIALLLIIKLFIIGKLHKNNLLSLIIKINHILSIKSNLEYSLKYLCLNIIINKKKFFTLNRIFK